MAAPNRQLLQILSGSGPLSRTVLAEWAALSKPAITAQVRTLLADGLLRETGPERLLALNPDAACFLGLSLSEREAALVLADLCGNAIRRASLASAGRMAPWQPDELAEAVAAALPGLLQGCAATGLGVAVPGLVELSGERCVQSSRLGWTDVPLAALLHRRTGLPVWLENDAHALARALHMIGPMRGASGFSLVVVDQGIGCGHVVDGRLLRGRHGGAGGIAHATLRANGVPCRCGKRGCLETLASLRALALAARAVRLPEEPGPLQRMADGGYPDAIQLLHDAGGALGLALAQMIQSLDPEQVLVGLDPALAGGLYGTAMRRAVAANVLAGFAGAAGGEPIRFLTLRATGWADGAAAVALHRFLWDRR